MDHGLCEELLGKLKRVRSQYLIVCYSKGETMEATARVDKAFSCRMMHCTQLYHTSTQFSNQETLKLLPDFDLN